MCTMTWRAAPGVREVYFNRDELKTRLPAASPRLQELNGTRYIAPRDEQAGGTWLFVNEHGLIVALLNLYPERFEAPWEPARSRGLLVADMADCRNLIEVSTYLHEEELGHYRPFSLLALHADYPEPLWVEWRSPECDFRQNASTHMPITGSSFKPDEVVLARKRRFREVTEGQAEAAPELLRRYHADTEGATGAHAVCMDRPDARTVSYSEVRVTPERIEYLYRARVGGAHEFGPDEVCVLELSRP